MIQNGISTRVQRELLSALESARTRLAVAMAAETKSTPLDRWQYYLDTTDRMYRYIKKLRQSDIAVSLAPQDLDQAIKSLRQLPDDDKAMRLCKMIRDIVTVLE